MAQEQQSFDMVVCKESINVLDGGVYMQSYSVDGKAVKSLTRDRDGIVIATRAGEFLIPWGNIREAKRSAVPQQR